MRARSLLVITAGAVLAAAALGGGAIVAAPAASATDFTSVLDNPAYWQQGDNADVVQYVTMAGNTTYFNGNASTTYTSTHPIYSMHRLDVLLDDGGRPVPGTTYLRLSTSFSSINTTNQDEFVSAVKLPAGVRITDSKSSPIFCRIAPNGLLSDTAVPFQIVTDGTCRQQPKDLGDNTFAVNDKVLNRGDIWEVYIPVTTDRAMGASDGAAAAVAFASTHANKDATDPAVAIATNILTIGAPSKSAAFTSASSPRAGAKCMKIGQRSGSVKCVKANGHLVWKRA